MPWHSISLIGHKVLNARKRQINFVHILLKTRPLCLKMPIKTAIFNTQRDLTAEDCGKSNRTNAS